MRHLRLMANKLDIEKLLRLHAEGNISKNIATTLGVSTSVVSYHLVRRGLTGHGNTLLSDEQKALILSLYRQGQNCHEIGRQAGCSHQGVRRVLKENGLKSNRKRGVSLNRIGDKKARCSECDKEKSIKKFSLHRRSTGNYRESYCDECRRKKVIARVNADVTRFISSAYSHLRSNCRKKDIKFQLNREHLLSLYERQNGLCFYTDRRMRCLIGNGASRDSLSVDRIVPEVGYVEGNVVLCTRLANSVKTDLTLIELGLWLPGWHQRLADYGLITY